MTKETLIVESRVRELLPDGTRLSADALEGLDQLVRDAIKKAINRCQANGRKTVIKEDF